MAEILGWLLFGAALVLIVILLGGIVYFVHEFFRELRRGRR